MPSRGRAGKPFKPLKGKVQFGASDKSFLAMWKVINDLEEAGEKRRAADAYLQAYRGKGKAWACRNVFLRAYCSLLARDTAATAADMQALRALSKDTSLTIAERVDAQYARGQALFAVGDSAGVAKVSSKLIQMAQAATPEERAAKVAIVGRDGTRWMAAGDLIDADAKRAKDNLDIMDPYAAYKALPPGMQLVRAKNTWPPKLCDKLTSAEQSAALVRAIRVRNSACSQCDRSAADVGLLCCKRCRLAWYCSPECQKANWKVHKPQCRAPGEHEAGDVVMLHGLTDRPQYNGQLFRLTAMDVSPEGTWEVYNFNMPEGPKFYVRPENLQHVLTH